MSSCLAFSTEPADTAPRDVFYRYYEVRYSPGVDEWGDPLPGVGRVEVHLEEIPVIKRTPCGAWIGYSPEDKRFVNLSWNKRYALPTIDEAKASYRARKRRQIGLLQAQARAAERALQAAEWQWAAE